MDIRHIISTIALGTGLGVAALAPVQVQAEEHRYDRGGDRYEERDHRGDRHADRKEHRHERRHDRYYGDFAHHDGQHAYKHRKHARRDHRKWHNWKRHHRHHGYVRVCRLPKHRHYGNHGHYPRGYRDGDVHGRVSYNDPDGWGAVFRF